MLGLGGQGQGWGTPVFGKAELFETVLGAGGLLPEWPLLFRPQQTKPRWWSRCSRLGA